MEKNKNLQNNSTFTSSLLPLTYYFQKILNANFSEKVKSEEVKSKNPERFRIQDFLAPRTGLEPVTS